ncbi:hypothetical protein FACS18942_03750 [Planctomycetales bacterium]|nr:hypothetical protein FACS18942_03750 [Planctomycetales bacterium]GHT39719.1 hypothetical protein FACS189427_13750 [Planctomycetales bacterium]
MGSASYYHRVLPFDLDLVEQLQPRLLNARKLIDENKVRITLKSKERTEAFVQGTDAEYFVRLTEDGAKCTCQWYAKHQGSRGPCKHILAAELVQTELG